SSQQRASGAPPLAPHRSTRVRARVQRRKGLRERGHPDNWAWMIVAIAVVGLVVVTALVVVMALQSSGGDDGAALAGGPSLEPTSAIYQGDTRGALDGNSLVIEPWDGSERFTVLLMGLDNRPGEQDLCRTDTMMIVSIDPVHDRIGLLSIPRDTYVDIPGVGVDKINTACVHGELYLPGYGPKLAMQTVQYNFGIRVNDYFMIDFNAFIQVIDRIGGIEVYVEQTIDDPEYPDMNYGFEPFYLEAGWQELDGETALKYARTRHTSDDIDRAQRQQQVIFAVRDKVLSLDMLDDLLAQAVPIWNDINDGVRTGLSLEQMVRLAAYAREVPSENIKNGVLDWNYLRPMPDLGPEAVVPDRAAMIPLLVEIFGEGYNQ
ncbi:MAG: LCP family protein, partial [Chloroflexi bacterium]|nr:LCP family protein [Chloroflexota bacterium]